MRENDDWPILWAGVSKQCLLAQKLETRKLQQGCYRLVCSLQADIGMRLHHWFELNVNKSAASCHATGLMQLIIGSFYPQA